MFSELTEKNIEVIHEGTTYSKFRISSVSKSRNHDYMVNSVLFFPPKFLISGSSDNKIVSYDVISKKVVHTVGFLDEVTDMIKVSPFTFFASSLSHYIKGFKVNMISGKIEKFFESRMSNGIFRIAKISDNSIASLVNTGHLVLLNINPKEIKEIVKCSINVHSNLHLSKKNSGYVFVSTDWFDAYVVKYVNTETSKVEKEIRFGVSATQIYCMRSYINSKNQEILIVGGINLRCYNIETMDLEFTVNTKNIIYSFILIQSKILIAGSGRQGGFSEVFFLKNENQNYVEIFSERCTCGYVLYLNLIEQESNNSFKVCCGNFDGSCQILDFQFEGRKSDIDEFERCDYVKEFYCQNYGIRMRNFNVNVGKLFLVEK